MNDPTAELKTIIDDMEAGLVDDPIEDFKYLHDEIRKYQDHPLREEITKSLGEKLFDDIPTAARKGLKPDFSGNEDAFKAFDFMIQEAEQYITEGQWVIGATILKNLIGPGMGIPDSDDTEYRSLENEMQLLLYQEFFKSEKKLLPTPIRTSRLYGLYGCAMMEFQKVDEARGLLGYSLHCNPLDFRFFFEYAETFKVKGEFEEFEKLNREYQEYAYTAQSMGHLYRNLGYVYIEKKQYSTAIALYYLSLAYDPDNEVAKQELAYIAHQIGSKGSAPSKGEVEKILEDENILAGVSDRVMKLLYGNAYTESHVHHDLEKTKYFCQYLLDVTGNEDLVKELLEAASETSSPVYAASESNGTSIYDFYKEKSLKEIFPEYPKIKECRLRMNFTIGSTKYASTVYLILDYVDEISKVVDGNSVSLLFTDIKAIIENIVYINDLYCIAGGWKSFELTINEIPRNRDDFRYFKDCLEDIINVTMPLYQSPEYIQKAYKREIAPKRAKRESREELIQTNLEGCTPQQIVSGLAMTYIRVYLEDYVVKSNQLSSDEIVLCVNDVLVVDFRVSPYGYAETMNGVTPVDEPYRDCTYLIQELTQNNLFKYNATAFKKCFTGALLPLEFLKFRGIDYSESEWNRFHIVNKSIPELHLQDKYNAWPGKKYTYVVLEMDHADGSIGTGIGYTDKDARSLVKKVCKELETSATSTIAAYGITGLEHDYSETLASAFLSWKGERKARRLEEHLRYYYFEEYIKESGKEYSAIHKYAEAAAAGEYSKVERKTYADLGRRTKK